MTTDRTRQSDAGFISVELLVAVGMSLLFFVFLCNFIFIQYGRGVVRAAADEGARAGSRVDASEVACKERAEYQLEGLGQMATDVTVDCVFDPATQRVNATISVSFQPWMPMVPVITETAVGTSLKEGDPDGALAAVGAP